MSHELKRAGLAIEGWVTLTEAQRGKDVRQAVRPNTQLNPFLFYATLCSWKAKFQPLNLNTITNVGVTNCFC